jgi:hypothetical protein
VWAVLVVPYAAAAVLLVVAGVPKALDPGDLHRAVRSVGMPVGPGAVRAFAVVEVVVGLVALLSPGRVGAALVGLLYAGFTGFVLTALRRGGVLSSCGCFGKSDTPPTRAHAVLTGSASVVGFAVALVPPADPWGALTPVSAVGALALVGLVGFLAWQVMAVLPSVDPRAVRSGTRG